MSEPAKPLPSPPVEIRYFLRKFTLDDARSGVQPVRLTIGRPDEKGMQQFDAFAPQPILQYRYRQVVYVNSEKRSEWSAWTDCAVVKEGDDVD